MQRMRVEKPLRRASFALGLALLSCSGTPEGTIAIVTGEETDAFSRTPAPVLLVTEKIASDGSRSELKRTSLPTDTLDLGELPRAEVAGVAVKALDGAGKVLLRGETLLVQWGALQNSTLEIFVQRVGELARMPRGPAAIEATHATMVVGRYVLATSGTSATLYDLLGLRTLTGAPILPRPAKSIVTVGTAALIIDEGGATTYDLATASSAAVEPPPGGTFAEVAGGDRVSARDGSQFVVGATRASGGPTARILMLDPDGKATFLGLTAPREGACSTWVEGRGLIVYGGDRGAAGAEVLAPGATLATPLPFPPDAVRGCAATTLDNTHVLVVGGARAADDDTTARVLDLACTTGCAATRWPDPVALVRAQSFALAPDSALVVGDDASGASHAFRISAAGGKRELPLRIPRRGARLVATPTAAFAVIGGGAGIEQYVE
jgi:hypothetical protein